MDKNVERRNFKRNSYIFIGNKNDSELEREVTRAREKFAEKHGFMISECSVKNDSWDLIKSFFEELAKTIY